MITLSRHTTLISERFTSCYWKPGPFVLKRKMSAISIDLRCKMNLFRHHLIRQLSRKAMRQPYKADTDVLLEAELPTKDPVSLFSKWFDEAKKNGGIYEPNAVCLASANK